MYEYLLLWGKNFIYHFTALNGIILLLQILNWLIEIYSFIKSLFFILFFVLKLIDDSAYEEKENIEYEWLVFFEFISIDFILPNLW